MDNRPEGVVAIANSPHMANLTYLDLSFGYEHQEDYPKGFPDDFYINDEGAKALANSPHLSNLETLILDGEHMSAEGAQALENSTQLTKLKTLKIE